MVCSVTMHLSKGRMTFLMYTILTGKALLLFRWFHFYWCKLFVQVTQWLPRDLMSIWVWCKFLGWIDSFHSFDWDGNREEECLKILDFWFDSLVMFCLIWDHSFSTFAKFSKTNISYPLIANERVRVRG